MEKKGTKIAYFIALAIVVIALVIAKVTNDGSGFVATGWALFPPVVAIALALISKEVYSSLFLGCLAGALLLANFQPWQMVVNFVGAGEGVGMINAIDISILIFLVMLGIMVDLMNKAGGSAAFGRWASKAVTTRRGAQLLTMLLGVLIMRAISTMMSVMFLSTDMVNLITGILLVAVLIIDRFTATKSADET